MDDPSAYIPMDRRQAIAVGENLLEYTRGAAVFADISGFTPLTEAFARELGPRRGAEELTVILNRVYDAIIEQLHNYSGSVVGFSGDAITCWIEGDDGRKALTASLAMQAAIQEYAQIRTASGQSYGLGLKAAVSTGTARRFVVGDPQYSLIDVLAGKTLDVLAEAEALAAKGEVITDLDTATKLEKYVTLSGTREDLESGRKFAIVSAIDADVTLTPWPEIDAKALEESETRNWLLPAVLDRMRRGQGEFLAELRPAVALFLHFSGLNYDSDPDAPAKLSRLVSEVEKILLNYDGSLIQLTIGDKGSYLYAAFGAPVAHEDDAVRACSTALELQYILSQLHFLRTYQVGIASGRMRTGAYGSARRRTYGVLGDAVNLAARLMTYAKPRQILVSNVTRIATAGAFTWKDLDPIYVKGKSAPIPVSRLKAIRRLQPPTPSQVSAAPTLFIGRKAELELIKTRLNLSSKGQGQVVAMRAEAGMGKTRFATEIISTARDLEFDAYSSLCASYGTSTSYLVWQRIWRDFFSLDPKDTTDVQVKQLRDELLRISKSLTFRLPLLAKVLNLPISDNPLTTTMDIKLRKASLEALLVACLRDRAERAPILLVLDACQWIDPLSFDLLEAIAKAIINLPVMLVFLYRNGGRKLVQESDIPGLPNFTEISLQEFSAEEARQFVQMRLQEMAAGASVSDRLINKIVIQSAGNPFYIDEFINYLRQAGYGERELGKLDTAELPSSVSSLILSRMDKLSERQQILLRVASVIGQQFTAEMVHGIYPEMGNKELIAEELVALENAELICKEPDGSEAGYAFKHMLTQQVAYDSLLSSTRAPLHERIARYIERNEGEPASQIIFLLTYHYEHSNNKEKTRIYLEKAAEAAQRDFAGSVANDYYMRLVPMLEAERQGEALINLGKIREVAGDWDAARQRYEQAESLAIRVGRRDTQARAEAAIGELLLKRSQFAEGTKWLAKALAGFEKAGDEPGTARVLEQLGTVSTYRGEFEQATDYFARSEAIYVARNDESGAAGVRRKIGLIAYFQGKIEEALKLTLESYDVHRGKGDRWSVAVSLIQLGDISVSAGDLERAREFFEKAHSIWSEIGDPRGSANVHHGFGNLAREENDLATARTHYMQALPNYMNLGDKHSLSRWLEDVAMLEAAAGNDLTALHMMGAAGKLRETVGAPRLPSEQARLSEILAHDKTDLAKDTVSQAIDEGRSMKIELLIGPYLQSSELSLP